MPQALRPFFIDEYQQVSWYALLISFANFTDSAGRDLAFGARDLKHRNAAKLRDLQKENTTPSTA